MTFWKTIRTIPLAGIVLLSACTSSTSPAPPAADNTQATAAMQVHMPSGEVANYPEVPFAKAAKVRDLMVSAAKAYPDFAFTDTNYIGMGHLVTGINNLRNPKGGGAYWQFCIDNVASELGIDEKEIAPGQTLDWHYAEYGKLPCKKIGE